jgi:hypothetical protein
MFKRITLSVLLLASTSISAADLGVGTVENAVNGTLTTIVETLALGADYKAVHYATPEGLIGGFDVGLEITAIELDQDFQDAMAQVGNSTDLVPSYLPLPRLSVIKGLPFGIDVGVSYLNITAEGFKIKNQGFSVKWAFIDIPGPFPTVAVRGSYNEGEYLDRITTKTVGFELLASMNLLVLEPYAGIGYQKGRGKVDLTGIPGADRLDLVTEPRVSQTKYTVGAALKLALIHFYVQADYGSKIKTYSAKLSVNM